MTEQKRNPFLFARLQELFGEVRTHTSRDGAGEYYSVDCPECGDTKSRLWFRHTWGERKTDGHRETHTAVCYNDHCFEDWQVRKKWLQIIRDGMPDTGRILTPAAAKPLEPVSLPGHVTRVDELEQICPGHPAVNYLQRRGYDCQTLGRRYAVSYCSRASDDTLAGAEGRIILPMIADGKIYGWTGRVISGLSTKELKERKIAKYFNLSGQPVSKILFGIDLAKHYRTVLLTEGAFDAMKTGERACAVWGSSLSSPQAGFLVKLNRMQGNRLHVFVCFDTDDHPTESGKSAEAAVRSLRALGVPAWRVTLPAGKDPGDHAPGELENYVRRFAEHNGINADWGRYELKGVTCEFLRDAGADGMVMQPVRRHSASQRKKVVEV
jgi:hypothetical protein